MTLPLVQLVSILAVPLLLGMALLGAFGLRWRDDPLAYLGWAYLTGTFGLGGLLFLWLVAGGPPDARVFVFCPIVGFVGLGAVIIRRRRSQDTGYGDELRVEGAATRPADPVWERVLFGAVVLFCGWLTWMRIRLSGYVPILRGDEAQIWAAKAKAIFLGGGFGTAFRELLQGGIEPSHPDYPLLNPLLQVWVFAHPGRVLDIDNRLPVLFFSLALVLVLAAALRRRVRGTVAALLLLILVGLRESSVNARTVQADGMVALGLLVTLDALLRLHEDGRAVWWRLAAVSAAFLLWSKNEGHFYFAALFVAVLLYRLFSDRGRSSLGRRELAWLLLPLATIALTWGFNAIFGLTNDMVQGVRESGALGMEQGAWERLRIILAFFWSELLLNEDHSGFLPLACAGLLILHPVRMFSGRMGLATTALVLIGLGYVAIYFVSHHDLSWHLPTSAARVTAQVLPALVLWTGLALGQMWHVLRHPG